MGPPSAELVVCHVLLLCYCSSREIGYGSYDFYESSPAAFVLPMDSVCGCERVRVRVRARVRVRVRVGVCVCLCLRRLAHLLSRALACPARSSLQ